METMLPVLVLLCYLCINAKYSAVAAYNDAKLTIRVNTFRRMDLLEYFLEYYATCEVVEQVQVVWSDPGNKAPVEWLNRFPGGKYLFEIHTTNSLNNRFKPLQDIPTQAVLSIDDDLIVPCEELSNVLAVWNSNKRALVGFSPRMHAHDIVSGALRYLKWQHTWWNGAYSIMLTKAAVLHKDYLLDFSKVLPAEVLQHVDKMRNCEDIAMAYVVAEKSQAAPVWVRAVIYEVSVGGISSGSSHFDIRSECLSMLKQRLPTWPWVTGFSKFVPLSVTDWLYRYWFDTK